MHLKLITCALITMVAPAFSAEGWLTNIEKAREVAAKEKKAVFVEFTGSDWCPPCMALKKDVFDSEEFKALAKEKLVTVELDFPQEKEISAEQKKYNNEQSEKYSISGYPTAMLMNEQGTTFWIRVGGTNDKDSYISEIKDALEKKDSILSNLEKAKSAKGMEKAKLLDQALKAMSSDLKEANANLADEIIALDKDDTLKYGEQKKEKEQFKTDEKEFSDFFRKEVSPLAGEEKFTEAIEKVEKYLTDKKLPAKSKQRFSTVIISLLLGSGEIDKALERAEEIIKIDVSSEMAQDIKGAIENIKNNREEIEKSIKDSKKS